MASRSEQPSLPTNATVELIADALLEGIEQDRGVLLQGKSVDQAPDELNPRPRFLRTQIKKK